jgi:endonuclease-3
VDTHIHRIAIRLGLIGPRITPEASHDALERLVVPGEFYNFHILLIRHGRRICKARRPRCHDCVLRRMCPAGAQFIRRGQAAGSVRG